MARGDHKNSTTPANGGKNFRGNKAHLPSKPCAACQRPMTWRKAWARCWDEVKFCSDACRKLGHSLRSAGD